MIFAKIKQLPETDGLPQPESKQVGDAMGVLDQITAWPTPPTAFNMRDIRYSWIENALLFGLSRKGF